MPDEGWKVNFQIYRQKGQEAAHLDSFSLEVNPDEYVLDAIERIWAIYDRSLTFRHACHHSTCGACGLRVDGREKLGCITAIREVTSNGGAVKIEPMRNFPVKSDLVVDMGTFFSRMEQVGMSSVVPLNLAPSPDSHDIRPDQDAPSDLYRLVDCIECGLCISACPVSLTNPDYLGPAVLAAAQQRGLDEASASHLLELVDGLNGVWRCHSAFECSEVCPSYVFPAWRIMDLRKQVVKERLKHTFGLRREVE